MEVISEPETPGTQSSSDGLVPPTPAEAAPVAVPGAPPPPPHEAVEAAHELEHETPGAQEAVDESPEEEADVPFAAPLELIDETVADEDLKFDWFILKVQVNREDSIKDALWRRVKMNGLDRYFREIVGPTEDVVEFTKTGKGRVVRNKLDQGHLLVKLAR